MRSLELFVTIGALGIGFIAICLTYTDFHAQFLSLVKLVYIFTQPYL